MEVLGSKSEEVPQRKVKSLVKTFVDYVRSAFENVYVEKEYEISVREHEALREYVRLYQDLYVNDFMFGKNNARLIILDALIVHYKYKIEPLYLRLGVSYEHNYPTLQEVNDIISKSDVI